MSSFKDWNYEETQANMCKLIKHFKENVEWKTEDELLFVIKLCVHYDPHMHKIAQLMCLVRGDYETRKTLYRKYGEKINNKLKLQSIFYTLCWFSPEFKETNEGSMSILKWAWDGIDEWVA